jgi:DNA-binding IclR family transcriptional regulator
MNKKRYFYSAKDSERMFDLLDILSKETTRMTVSILAKRLSMRQSGIIRLLEILESRQLVEHDETTGECKLGMGAYLMSQSILNSNNVLKLAHPIMDELARKLDEAIYITVMNNDEVLFLDMVDSLQKIKTVPLVGYRFPFFTNAAGKAITAMSALDIFERKGRRWTKKQDIQDIDKLLQELQEIRQRGVAIEAGGLGKDICSVAVAVRDYAGKVIGALTMLAPTFRMFQERLEQEIIPAMQCGAELLSMKFGYIKTPA